MIAESFKTRDIKFAYLFGPPRFVRREEATKVHTAVCDALKYDDLAFRYSPLSEPTDRRTAKGFSIVLERPEGRGAFRVIVDLRPEQAQGAMRLLMEYLWPPALHIVTEQFDMTADAVFEAMAGDWQKVLAEVRWRAECDVKQATALEFFRKRFLALDQESIDSLGKPLVFTSVSFNIARTPRVEDLLDGPDRTVKIEVLREDPASLYLELTSQWTQSPAGSLAPSAGGGMFVQPLDKPPKDFIGNCERYFHEHVLTLGSDEGGKK